MYPCDKYYKYVEDRTERMEVITKEMMTTVLYIK